MGIRRYATRDAVRSGRRLTSARNTIGIRTVEIQDRHPRGYLDFDLIDVLDALHPRADRLDWIVTDFDPVGESEAQSLAREVENARLPSGAHEGVRLAGADLRRVATKTNQTIDGEFVGVPPETDAPNAELADLSRFPDSPASLVIKAIDSTLFIVITKAASDVGRLKERFRDVRDGDTAAELGLP